MRNPTRSLMAPDAGRRLGIAGRQAHARAESGLPDQYGFGPLGIAWLVHAQDHEPGMEIEVANQVMRGLECG